MPEQIVWGRVATFGLWTSLETIPPMEPGSTYEKSIIVTRFILFNIEITKNFYGIGCPVYFDKEK